MVNFIFNNLKEAHNMSISNKGFGFLFEMG